MSKRSDKLLIFAGPLLGAVLLKLLRLTLRLKVINRPPKDTQLIFSFWHGRILLMPFMNLARPILRDGQQAQGRGAYSQAGKIFRHCLIARLNHPRRHLGAERADKARPRRIQHCVHTRRPQGPQVRRPAGSNPGGEGDRPSDISPYIFRTQKKTLKSWDSFIIPYPFTQAVAIWGDPLYVPRDADKETAEALRAELERRMRELKDKADNWWGPK